MFQDVRHSRIIWGIRLEPDGEDIVLILPGNVEIISASLVVLEVQGRQLEFRDMLRTDQSEAM